MDSPNQYQTEERENIHEVKEQKSSLALCESLTLTGVDSCYHISYVKSDQAWVSDDNDLILTNAAGDSLKQLNDVRTDIFRGVHTVNSDGDLIYINKDYNISKLSHDMESYTTLIDKTVLAWTPLCVFCSSLTGDLLVGTSGMVNRYNTNGELVQTIQHDIEGLELYTQPNYITENRNGDVVVSDSVSALIVTDCKGVHRFTYTGNLPGSEQRLWGICTDELLNILMCDERSKAIHVIDKDGQFLMYLLKKEKDIDKPCSLSYDANNNFLWVGSLQENKLCVYNYSSKQDDYSGKGKYNFTVLPDRSSRHTLNTKYFIHRKYNKL